MFYGATPEIFDRARKLRTRMTRAEKLLWEELKGNKLDGFRFKPQHPIHRFIADFYCHKLKLVIEVDGKIHESIEQAELDEGRTYELEQFGLTVIRVSNEDVFYRRDKVLDALRTFISNSQDRDTPALKGDKPKFSL